MPETDARNDDAMLPRLDDHDVWTRIEALPGPALVLVSSVFCGGCRLLRRRLSGAIAADPSGRLQERIFELDAGESPGFVQAAEVFHLPALVSVAPGAEPEELPLEPGLSGEALARALLAGLEVD